MGSSGSAADPPGYDRCVSPELLSEVTEVEVIARGQAIRELDRLKKKYGLAEWRKLKGIADVRLPDGTVARAEVHWYEAHGLGRREMKVKCLVG
jgi:hypothetical protein